MDLSTPPCSCESAGVALLPVSALPPAALAVASAAALPLALASKVTLPPALILRAVIAFAASLITFTAMARPTAALPPSAAPLAIVMVSPVLLAETLISPVTFNRLPFPISLMLAVAILSTTDRPTTGVIAIPPAAPASAVVRITWLPRALSVTSSAPVISPLSSAIALFVSMFIAIDAPKPKLPPVPPFPCGVALALLVVLFSASMVTEPVFTAS